MRNYIATLIPVAWALGVALAIRDAHGTTYGHWAFAGFMVFALLFFWLCCFVAIDIIKKG